MSKTEEGSGVCKIVAKSEFGPGVTESKLEGSEKVQFETGKLFAEKVGALVVPEYICAP